MSSLVQPARVLVDPLDATGAAVEARRWFWPLVLLIVSVSASGTAFSVRWDAGPAVVQELQMAGKLGQMTETEISDEIQTASRKALVGGIAKGLFVMPLQVVLLAAVLWLCGWLFDTSASFGRLMSVAALAMLPIALYHLIFTVCALAQYSLSQERMAELVPASLAVLQGLSPKVKKVLAAVDFFNLWSVGLMGLGFSAATGMRRSRALLLCLTLYLLFVGVFSIGLPVLMAGEPGGPARGGR
jgi:Yip1 domain